MRIIPYSDIAIGRAHCARGEPVEVPESVGISLCAQGIARRCYAGLAAAAAREAEVAALATPTPARTRAPRSALLPS